MTSAQQHVPRNTAGSRQAAQHRQPHRAAANARYLPRPPHRAEPGDLRAASSADSSPSTRADSAGPVLAELGVGYLVRAVAQVGDVRELDQVSRPSPRQVMEPQAGRTSRTISGRRWTGSPCNTSMERTVFAPRMMAAAWPARET